jgi:hypothetical protein
MNLRRYIIWIAILGLAVGLILPALNTPQFVFPIDQIESIENPIAVHGWDENGLMLADGRHVALPGIVRLPLESESLTRAVADGVEVDSDGRVVGLLKIHHWCGNDRVRNHVARIDLAHLLTFLGEVEFETKVKILKDMRQDEFSFSEFGWNVSDYHQFLRWSEAAKEEGI